MDAQCLRYISAPMVNQSDFGFRLLTRKYNATLTYTQMLDPQRLVDDKDYLEFHLRDLHLTRQVDYASPVVVQLCGNNPQTIVDGGRKIQAFCDGIGPFFIYLFYLFCFCFHC
jgi:tRNA-dihydrouridine synthase 1